MKKLFLLGVLASLALGASASQANNFNPVSSAIKTSAEELIDVVYTSRGTFSLYGNRWTGIITEIRNASGSLVEGTAKFDNNCSVLFVILNLKINGETYQDYVPVGY